MCRAGNPGRYVHLLSEVFPRQLTRLGQPQLPTSSFPLIGEMKEQLISSSSSTSSEDENHLHQLTINEHYANAFQYRKERDELAKRTHCPS